MVDKKSYMGLDCSIFVVTLKVLSSEMVQAKMISSESSLDKGKRGDCQLISPTPPTCESPIKLQRKLASNIIIPFKNFTAPLATVSKCVHSAIANNCIK